MTTPRVSFILPIHNAGKTLRETLDSLFAQTFGDFEIIAVNDGSTDQTAGVLAQTPDPRLRVIARENRGLVASLNEAIDASKAELLARIDADDICLPHRLEKQIAFLHANPHVGVVGSAIIAFNNENEERITHAAFPAATLLFRSAIAHPSVMIRRKLLDACNLRYRHPYHCAQDYDLWCRCIVRGICIMNLTDPLIRYRLHPGQITQAHAEPTQLEGEAIRAEFIQSLLPATTGPELKLHNAIARHQLVPTEDFLSRAAAWLVHLAQSPALEKFMSADSLLPVLTGRYVSICRFARAHRLPFRETDLFTPHIRPGALDQG